MFHKFYSFINGNRFIVPYLFIPESIIPVEKGVKIKVLGNEIKKVKSLSDKAEEFRNRVLYGNRQDRISSKFIYSSVS